MNAIIAEKFSSFVTSYVFSPGRRIVTAQTILDVATEVGDTELAQQATEAIAFDRNVWQMQRKWEKTRTIKEGTRVDLRQIDQQLDRNLVGIFNVADGHVYSLLPGDEQYDISQAFLEEFFPNGPGAITRLPYEDQLATVDAYLVRWHSDWKDRLDKLALTTLVARATSLTAEYRKGVTTIAQRDLTWDEVKATDNIGQELMLALVIRVCGFYNSQSPDDINMRTRYLATFIDQNQRIAQIRKRTPIVADIDPDSGEEIPTPTGDTETTDTTETVES